MTPDNQTLPAEMQTAFTDSGVFISIEGDEIDALYHQLMPDGFKAIVELCDEPWVSGTLSFGIQVARLSIL